MPRGDQTGPEGMGPQTGRGAGFCAGYDMPGYANPHIARMGMGWRARGGGHWHPGRFGGRGFGWMRYAAYEVPDPANMTPEERLEKLKKRENWLQTELDAIRRDIGETQNPAEKK